MANRYIPKGSEFRVNTYTADRQDDSAVASLISGKFVVAWHFYGEESFEYKDLIYLQVYEGNGLRVSEEIVIRDLDRGRFPKIDPAITGLAGGGFVVSWTSLFQDGSSTGVYGQIFDADGVKISDGFRANTYTSGPQSNSSITALMGGGFVVTWSSGYYGSSGSQDSSGSGIFGQIYNSAGVRVGEEFRANTHTVLGQSDPSIAGLIDGGFVVTWTSEQQDSSGFGLYAQVYDDLGRRVGDEFRVNTYTANDQYDSSITSLSEGGFVVVWTSNKQEGALIGVYGQVFDVNGSRVGAEFRVNSALGSHVYPAVAALEGGDFVVTWTAFGQDGPNWGVYGQVFSSDGSSIGDEFRVNTYTEGYQGNPSVTGLLDGSFVVTWTSDGQDGSGLGVYGQLFSRLENSPPTGAVTITGNAREGSALTAVTSALADADGLGSFSYQWFANDTAISGATGSTFTPGEAQVGKAMTVRVSYTDDYGTAESVTSLATSEVGIGARIQRSESFLLPDNGYTTDLTLTGSANINGTGNKLANTIVGNTGNNRLDGGSGRDTMLGGSGNDTYIVDNAGDRVFETTSASSSIDAGGKDTVLSSVTFNLDGYIGVRFVENLTLTGSANTNGTGNTKNNLVKGNAGNNVLTGLAGNDTLQGGAGADTIIGGLGRDRMTGGTGSDVFVFRSTVESGTTTAYRDVVTDFTAGEDIINLRGIDADSTRTNNQAFNFIGDAVFTGKAGELRFANSILSADVNGDKRADFQVLLSGVELLSAADIIL